MLYLLSLTFEKRWLWISKANEMTTTRRPTSRAKGSSACPTNNNDAATDYDKLTKKRRRRRYFFGIERSRLIRLLCLTNIITIWLLAVVTFKNKATASTKGIDRLTAEKQQDIQIAVTTHYGGEIGKAWENVTRKSLEDYCDDHGYKFLPWMDGRSSSTPNTSGGIIKFAQQFIPNPTHKWSKIDAIRGALQQVPPNNGWVWWTDADVLLTQEKTSQNFRIEALIERVQKAVVERRRHLDNNGVIVRGNDEDDGVHIILLRRRAVTSSNLLIRNSPIGMDFLNEWNRQHHGPSDQKALNGMLRQALINSDNLCPPSTGQKEIHQYYCSRYHRGGLVVQVDCVCTDLKQPCDDWWCEGLYPFNYDTTNNFAIHAAGCRYQQGQTFKTCIDGMKQIAEHQMSTKSVVPLTPTTETSLSRGTHHFYNSKNETIYGVAISKTAKQALFATKQFFQQTYPYKRLVIVTEAFGQEFDKFLSFLSPFMKSSSKEDENMSQVLLVQQPLNNSKLGALRQAGIDVLGGILERSEEAADTEIESLVFVQWDDDDIRHADLIQQQYNNLGPYSDSLVLLNQQVQFDLRRNASIILGGGGRSSKWHGIAGTIMGRMTKDSMAQYSYDPSLSKGEDSEFLRSILRTQESPRLAGQDGFFRPHAVDVHVWENPSHWYIRISHSGFHASGTKGVGSMRGILQRVRDNQWLVPNDPDVFHMLRQIYRVVGDLYLEEEQYDDKYQNAKVPSSFLKTDSAIVGSETVQYQIGTWSEPTIYVLYTKSRKPNVEAMIKNSGMNSSKVHLVEGIASSDIEINELISHQKLFWKTVPTHEAKRPLTLGQIAVHMGHISMLQLFEDTEDEYAVFLEDDAISNDDFTRQIKEVYQNSPSDWELINLGRCLADCRSVVSKSTSTATAWIFNPVYELCQAGYMVHRRGIAKLLKLSLPMGHVAGDKHWHQLSLKRIIKGYSLSPSIVWQNRQHMFSLKTGYAVDNDDECRNYTTTPADRTPCFVQSSHDSPWKFCSNEDDVCACPAGSLVRYGCGEEWTPLETETPYIAPAKPFKCSSNFFGDPFPYRKKICQCLVERSSGRKDDKPKAVASISSPNEKHDWKNEWCVILTATITPHKDVDRLSQRDSHEREQTYYDSLLFWTNQSSLPVLFAENSNADLTRLRTLENDRIRILQIPSNTTRRNKGIGERDTVFSALQKEASDFLSECGGFVKITGRFAPVGLDDALSNCPADTKLLVQAKTSRFGGGGRDTNLWMA